MSRLLLRCWIVGGAVIVLVTAAVVWLDPAQRGGTGPVPPAEPLAGATGPVVRPTVELREVFAAIGAGSDQQSLAQPRAKMQDGEVWAAGESGEVDGFKVVRALLGITMLILAAVGVVTLLFLLNDARGSAAATVSRRTGFIESA